MNNKNEQLHTRFMGYYEKAFRPNITLICKEMDVPYTSFLKWKNGYLLFPEANLSKIEAFLNNHNE